MLFDLTPKTLHMMASSPYATTALLEELSNSIDEKIRARVAEHRNTSLRALFKLVQDVSVDVRLSTAYNPNANSTLLWQLADDASADVRYSVAENALVPIEILRKLSLDENPYVAHRALRTLDRLRSSEQNAKAA